jgi:hypothetical protein
MRVSDIYGLGLQQGELDFVDIDVDGDTRVYIDPHAFRYLHGKWAHECTSLIQSFFHELLDAIVGGNRPRGDQLLSGLREPNETRFGLSSGRPRGHGLGDRLGDDLWNSLSSSRAVQTGLVEDLEDTILLVRGIGFDIVSDITTNIIRGPLLDYTRLACESYEIPMASGVVSGGMWNPRSRTWTQALVERPVATTGPILLVPKLVVRRGLSYELNEYYWHYILPFLQERELSSAGSRLVRLVKSSGVPYVTKKSLVEKYGSGKDTIIDLTVAHPEILDGYREAKRGPTDPLTHGELAELTGVDPPDWDKLLGDVIDLSPGRSAADAFNKAVAALLEAVFYPDLDMPTIERPLHAGRKRVDITFANEARANFFRWLATHYHAPYVFVECKNYSSDPANPELDQLAGRFSRDRGTIGFLVCRDFDDKPLFVQRCRDTARDGRGFIIALDDDDLRQIVAMRRDNRALDLARFLQRRFDELL